MPAHLFDSLVNDADRIPLVPPEALRRVGNTRARRRAAVLTGAVTLAVIGGILTALRWLPSTAEPAPVIGSTGESPTTTSTSTDPSGRCSATDLRYSHQTPGAASGNAVVRYTFLMVGPSTCRLQDAPVLTHSEGSTRTTVPLVPDGAPTEVVARPGDTVEFTVQTVNGYGGYSTNAPECATLRTYRQLGVLMPDGGTIPLTGATDLTIQCLGGDGQLGSITSWTTTR